MKFLRGFFVFLGVLAFAGVLVVGVSLLLKPSELPVAEGTGAISPEMVVQAQEMARQVGQRMAWVMVLVSVALQILAWVMAGMKLHALKKANLGAPKTLEMLEAIDIYFDLPLYFGLLGSVGSFIVITFYPDAGLMFAYASTAMGIIVSVILRLGYHTPFKQQLLTTPAAAE